MQAGGLETLRSPHAASQRPVGCRGARTRPWDVQAGGEARCPDSVLGKREAEGGL